MSRTEELRDIADQLDQQENMYLWYLARRLRTLADEIEALDE